MADKNEDVELRESLSEAFTEHEGKDTDDPEPDKDTDKSEDTPDDDTGDSEDDSEESDDTGDSEESDESSDGEDDEDAEGDKPEEEQVAKESGEGEEKEPAVKVTHAPSSWKPNAREHWERLDPAVQTEINRREHEIRRGLQESKDSRKLQTEFNDTVRPYMHFIEAENSTPIAAVKNMMQTAAVFRVGTAQQKAQTAAGIIKNFGIDIQMLDDILSGQAVDDPVARQVKEQMAPVTAYVQRMQAQEANRQSEVNTSVSETLEAFATDPANEFFNDVKDTMADLLDVANTQGKNLDLPTAYKRAIMLHDDISEVVTQRKLKSQAKVNTASVKKARRKAVSLSGSPDVGQPSKKGNTMRDDIKDAIASRMED